MKSSGLHSRLIPGLLLLVLGAGACAPRTQTGTLPPVPAREDVDATRRASLEDVLGQSRARATSGEDLFGEGLTEAAQEEFRQAIALLENYLDQTPEASDRLREEITDLRLRLDSIGAIAPALPSPLELPSASAPLRDRLPIARTDPVLARLEYFTVGTGRSTIEVGLERAGLYRPMIERILREEGIPTELIYLAQAESAFKPEAVSVSAARGLWQFIPARGEEYGLRQSFWIDERSDPEKSTRAAARHLSDLFVQFGDWYLAMAAYNAGPGRVERAIEETGSRDFWVLAGQGALPSQTRNYVPTIIAMAIIGEDPGAWGFDITPEPAPDTTRVRVGTATDLRIISERLDLALEDVERLNPHLLRWATPPDDEEFELVLPVTLKERYLTEIAPLPEQERMLFTHHLVAAGETLSEISRGHGVPLTAIVDANRLANPDTLRVGQELMIPVSRTPNIPPTSPAIPQEAEPEVPPAQYAIRSGDTLSTIARRFGLHVADIRAWNDMSSDMLIAGYTLRLTPPNAGVDSQETDVPTAPIIYDVRPGDTLWSIARAYSISVEDIRKWNLDSDLSVIRPGDAITISRGTTLQVE